MSVCVCFVCKEDLNKSNKYTNLAKKNISFWGNKFPTYVLTNNIEEFQKLNCKIIFDNTYFSQFNKFDIINLLQMEYKTVIYLGREDKIDKDCPLIGYTWRKKYQRK